MSLLFQFAPLSSSRSPADVVDLTRRTGRPAPVPTSALTSRGRDEHDRSVDDAEALARVLLRDVAADSDELAVLEAGVDEHVDVWTPALHTVSRFELVCALTDADDAICDVAVRFTDSAGTPGSALSAWLVTGRFMRPVILDDDHLIEPTGAIVQLAGVITVSFTPSRRADRIRCYYDRMSLIEQMLSTGDASDGA